MRYVVEAIFFFKVEVTLLASGVFICAVLWQCTHRAEDKAHHGSWCMRSHEVEKIKPER